MHGSAVDGPLRRAAVRRRGKRSHAKQKGETLVQLPGWLTAAAGTSLLDFDASVRRRTGDGFLRRAVPGVQFRLPGVGLTL